MTQATKTEKTFVEEVKVTGAELVERVKELAKEGNVRTLSIIADDGELFLKTPLTIGIVVGGVVVLAAPWLAILGVIAGFVTEVKIEVERVADHEADEAPIA